jgi:NhaP-type Na+/H+ or K+/H+ antiporter
MHQSIERLERLLTLTVLLLLGAALANQLWSDLTWEGVLVGVALVFVVRPLAGLIAFRVGGRREWLGYRTLSRREELAIAWFGVRGVSSVFYVAYAAGQADFAEVDTIWATVAFTIAFSVLVHGISATPVMARLDRAQGRDVSERS